MGGTPQFVGLPDMKLEAAAGVASGRLDVAMERSWSWMNR
jgi:hypothetical protein